MAPTEAPHVVEFNKALEGWVDERFASREQIRALAMFSLYLVNLAEEDGWSYDGHSLKVASPLVTLTVKSTIEGVPHVVFTSARTPTASIRIFMRKLSEGLLEWRLDKYRQ